LLEISTPPYTAELFLALTFLVHCVGGLDAANSRQRLPFKLGSALLRGRRQTTDRDYDYDKKRWIELKKWIPTRK